MKHSALILTFVTTGFLAFPLAVQAQKKGATKAPAAAAATDDDSEEATADDYVELMDAMFDNMTETAELIAGVTDAAEAKAAVSELNAATAELQELRDALAELGVPSPSVKKELDTKTDMGPKGNKAGEALKKAMTGIPKDAAALGEPLQNYGTTLAALGNDLSNLDKAAESGSKKPATKPTKPEAGDGAADDYVEVLDSLLDVQMKVGDILAEVTDEETATAGAKKIKRLTKEAAALVAEFKALGTPSAAANAAMEKNADIPKKTQEVTAHITKSAQGLAKLPAAAKIIGPALTEFSNTCQSIGESDDAPKTKPSKAPADKDYVAADYIKLATRMIKNMEAGADALESVTDDASAKAATATLEKLSEEWAELDAEKALMPKPEGALKAELDKNKTIDVLGNKAHAHVQKAVEYIKKSEGVKNEAVQQALETAGKAWLKAVGVES